MNLDKKRVAELYEAYVRSQPNADLAGAYAFICKRLGLPQGDAARQALSNMLEPVNEMNRPFDRGVRFDPDGFDHNDVSEQSFPCSDPPPVP